MGVPKLTSDAPVAQMLRLATESDEGVLWVLRRNCSLSPSQLGGLFVALCVLSLAVAGFFWLLGAWMVLPFAAVELTAVGAAFLVYARHATDREIISVSRGVLVVEWEDAGRFTRTEFVGHALQVKAPSGRDRLIELRWGTRSARVGRYLRPELRPVLVKELRDALGRM